MISVKYADIMEVQFNSTMMEHITIKRTLNCKAYNLVEFKQDGKHFKTALVISSHFSKVEICLFKMMQYLYYC